MKRILAWKLNLYVKDDSSTNPQLYSITESTIIGENALRLHQFLNLLLNEREANFWSSWDCGVGKVWYESLIVLLYSCTCPWIVEIAVALRGSNGWRITFVLEWLMLVLEDQFFLGQKKGCKSLIRCFCKLVCCILCTVDNRRKGKLRYCSYFPLLYL